MPYWRKDNAYHYYLFYSLLFCQKKIASRVAICISLITSNGNRLKYLFTTHFNFLNL